jgi:hypothetical protein
VGLLPSPALRDRTTLSAVGTFLVGLAVIAVAWGCVLIIFPKPIARFARKVQGEFWGRQFTPELTRFAGCGFVLGGVIAAATLVAELLRG